MTALSLIQVALGLAVVYLLVCLLASGVRELIARFLGERGKLLQQSLKNLLSDRWVYLRVINHPVMSGLYRDVPGRGKPPSYVPGRNFAQALLDVLAGRQRLASNARTKKAAAFDLKGLQKAVRNAKGEDLAIGHALQPMVEGAASLDEALANVEQWFESSAARIGGWYKARTQKMLFFIGFGIAITFNVDTIQIASTLAQSEGLRAAITATAERLTAEGLPQQGQADAAKAELVKLAAAGLPIGYSCVGTPTRAPTSDAPLRALTFTALKEKCWSEASQYGLGFWVVKLAGWLLTALATMLGAPFWFDAIGRVVSLRGAGSKPSTVGGGGSNVSNGKSKNG
jgi:hypothetical protein